MGDTADMMMDGTLCCACSCVFDDMLPTDEELTRAKVCGGLPVAEAEPPGHPRICKECEQDLGEDECRRILDDARAHQELVARADITVSVTLERPRRRRRGGRR